MGLMSFELSGVKPSFHLIHSRPETMADAGPAPDANTNAMAVNGGIARWQGRLRP